MFWAVGAAEKKKPPNCHKYATFWGRFFQLFEGKNFFEIFFKKKLMFHQDCLQAFTETMLNDK